MSDVFRCDICTSDRSIRLNTYKHVWDECADCGNVFRKRKDEYLATKVLPRGIWSRISGTDRRFLRTFDRVLLPRLDVIADAENIYTYYEDCVRQGVTKTKYADEARFYDERFSRFGIEIADKAVLDVSGGPGFLVQHMAKRAKRAVMTEYDSNIVNVARDALGIETAHYDFNRHDLDRTVEGKFDVVLVRYAINFCLDPKKFLAELRRMLNPGASVYVAFVLPSLGVCLRYQFDDYTYPVLYNPETLTRLFAESGFDLKHRDVDSNYPYRMQATPLHQVMYTPYALAGRLSGFAPELVVKSRVHVYRVGDDLPPTLS